MGRTTESRMAKATVTGSVVARAPSPCRPHGLLARATRRPWPRRTQWNGPLRLPIRGGLGAQALLGGPEFARRIARREIFRREHLAKFEHHVLSEGRPFHPGDCLFLRLHLDQPEAGDQLLRLRKGPVAHRGLAARELDACALGTRVESFAREH